jgi:hypothetical protein
MPILSILEKGSSLTTNSTDNKKNDMPKTEKRCYFGLLSLRSGVIAYSTACLVSVPCRLKYFYAT